MEVFAEDEAPVILVEIKSFGLHDTGFPVIYGTSIAVPGPGPVSGQFMIETRAVSGRHEPVTNPATDLLRRAVLVMLQPDANRVDMLGVGVPGLPDIVVDLSDEPRLRIIVAVTPQFFLNRYIRTV